MRQDYWQLGTWGRIPVSMHWTVLLSAAWLYIIFQDVVATLIGCVGMVILMLAHEYGHVFALRRRKLGVTGISLFGVHGETAYNEYAAKGNDAIVVAWGGVAAQAIVMAVALIANATIPFDAIPLGNIVWAPLYFMFTKFNVFLMIVALLPIGPFDGHAAWKIIPRRKPRRAQKPRVKPAPVEPDPSLTPEEQREFDATSEKETADLIARLTRKSDAPTQDR
jgi:Zn-dependent protease